MIGLIKTRFRNWLRRDRLILSHHKLIDSLGIVSIQTALQLQDVIDAQLAISKRVAQFMEDKHEQKKALDLIAKLESGTDARKALLEEMRAEFAEIFPRKSQA